MPEASDQGRADGSKTPCRVPCLFDKFLMLLDVLLLRVFLKPKGRVGETLGRKTSETRKRPQSVGTGSSSNQVCGLTAFFFVTYLTI